MFLRYAFIIGLYALYIMAEVMIDRLSTVDRRWFHIMGLFAGVAGLIYSELQNIDALGSFFMLIICNSVYELYKIVRKK